MSIAAYCRTSTTRQKNDGQIAEIKRWLAAHGYDESQVTWFIDQESGKTLRRTAFDRLQAGIFAGQVRTVVLWKLDRLSRCLRDGINVLADWCERGIKVVVLTQQIELDGPVGRMIAALLLGLAEIELEYRRERQTAGIDVARRRGIYSGRKQGSTKATPERAAALRSSGLTTDEIAQALGTSRRTVQRYLRTGQPNPNLVPHRRYKDFPTSENSARVFQEVLASADYDVGLGQQVARIQTAQ